MTRYIDADALKKANERLLHCDFPYLSETTLEELIDEAPTIEAEPVRHGKWITEECLPGVAVCSICGHEIRGIGCQYTKYCDECGARMDEND